VSDRDELFPLVKESGWQDLNLRPLDPQNCATGERLSAGNQFSQVITDSPTSANSRLHPR
jgi:hypothetical protein